MPIAINVLILALPESKRVIISGGTNAFTAALNKIAIEKYFAIYLVLP